MTDNTKQPVHASKPQPGARVRIGRGLDGTKDPSLPYKTSNAKGKMVNIKEPQKPPKPTKNQKTESATPTNSPQKQKSESTRPQKTADNISTTSSAFSSTKPRPGARARIGRKPEAQFDSPKTSQPPKSIQPEKVPQKPIKTTAPKENLKPKKLMRTDTELLKQQLKNTERVTAPPKTSEAKEPVKTVTGNIVTTKEPVKVTGTEGKLKQPVNEDGLSPKDTVKVTAQSKTSETKEPAKAVTGNIATTKEPLKLTGTEAKPKKPVNEQVLSSKDTVKVTAPPKTSEIKEPAKTVTGNIATTKEPPKLTGTEAKPKKPVNEQVLSPKDTVKVTVPPKTSEIKEPAKTVTGNIATTKEPVRVTGKEGKPKEPVNEHGLSPKDTVKVTAPPKTSETKGPGKSVTGNIVSTREPVKVTGAGAKPKELVNEHGLPKQAKGSGSPIVETNGPLKATERSAVKPTGSPKKIAESSPLLETKEPVKITGNVTITATREPVKSAGRPLSPKLKESVKVTTSIVSSKPREAVNITRPSANLKPKQPVYITKPLVRPQVKEQPTFETRKPTTQAGKLPVRSTVLPSYQITGSMKIIASQAVRQVKAPGVPSRPIVKQPIAAAGQSGRPAARPISYNCSLAGTSLSSRLGEKKLQQGTNGGVIRLKIVEVVSTPMIVEAVELLDLITVLCVTQTIQAVLILQVTDPVNTAVILEVTEPINTAVILEITASVRSAAPKLIAVVPVITDKECRGTSGLSVHQRIKESTKTIGLSENQVATVAFKIRSHHEKKKRQTFISYQDWKISKVMEQNALRGS